MFKQVIKFCKTSSTPTISNLLRYRAFSTTTIVGEKWDLFTAVCVERHPLITKPKTELEEKFQDMLDEIEIENSMKSDHELRFDADKRHEDNLKKGVVEVDPDQKATQTAQDIEDAGDAELAGFKFAPRLTEADKENKITSLERKLDKSLMLLVEQKIGQGSLWLPPQGIREDSETLRQAAERVLKKTCGDDLKAIIYGNAPIGFYKYVYPKKVREGDTRGAKVFYYLAKYEDGNVKDEVKYQWLDRQELEKNLAKPIHKAISLFLVTE